MVHALLRFLQRPYPKSKESLVFPLSSGILVALFLFVFKPFGLSNFSGDLLRVSIGYGLVTFVCTGLIGTLHYLLRTKLPPWTLGAELLLICLNLLLIAIGNAWFTSLVWNNPFGWKLLLYFIPITVAVGLVPILFFLFLREWRLRKAFQLEAQKFEKLRTKGTEQGSQAATPVRNLADVSLQHPLPEIVHFEAQGNFLVYRLRNSNRPHTVNGYRFSQIATKLEGHPDFLQVHRSHIIKLSAVRSVNGNARGLELILENKDTIPVARSRIEVFREVYQRRFGHIPA